MAQHSIATALIAEHHEIDAGIDNFLRDMSELGDSPSPEQVREAANKLSASFAALRRHIYLEEEFVFPVLEDPSLSMALMVMYREHGVIWRLMDDAERQIVEAESSQQTIETCQKMLAELERHNAKEEPIIYPHADEDLAKEQRERLADFLNSGQMPDGWVCREAIAVNGGRSLPF